MRNLVLLPAILFLLSINAYSSEPDVVATVNGEEIRVSELKARMSASRGAKDHQAVLEVLIKERLLLQEGKRLNIEPDEKEFYNALGFMPSLGGMDLKSLLRHWKVDKIRNRLLQIYQKEVSFTEEELEAEFEKRRTMLQPERVKARQIVLDSLEDAEKVFRRLKEGEDFAELAQRCSRDRNTAPRGGDLGYRGRNSMPKEVDKVLFESDVGLVERPIKTKYGYHIVKIEEKIRPGETTLEKTRPTVERMVSFKKAKEKLSQRLTELRAEAKIETNLQALTGGREDTLALPPVVAIVNGKEIPRSEVLVRLGHAEAMNPESFQKKTPKEIQAMVSQLIEGLIKQEVLLGEADRHGIKVTKEEVEGQYAALKSQFPSEEEFEDFLLKKGKTSSKQWKRDMYAVLRIQKLENKLSSSLPVSEEEIRSYYDRNKSSFKGEMVKASHILVKDKETAEGILSQLKNGKTFEELAREHSLDTGSKVRDGQLDWFGPGEMAPEFEKAAFSLKPGEISPPVKTTFGYHLIRLEERESAQELTLEDLKDRIRRSIQQFRWFKQREDWISSLKAKANIHKTEVPSLAVRDPYCGKEIDITKASHVGVYKGEAKYFCSKECQEGFFSQSKENLSQYQCPCFGGIWYQPREEPKRCPWCGDSMPECGILLN